MEDALRFTPCGAFAGNDLTLLREDLLPLACGGNKVRIALKLLADAKAKGAEHIVAYGNARSNLCRVVAMLCVREGLSCTVVSPSDDDGTRADSINARIAVGCGAEIVRCDKGAGVADVVQGTLDRLTAAGRRPYYVFGDRFGKGNEAVLASAYREVGRELAGIVSGGEMRFDRIALAVGTGSTCGGLLAGLRESGCSVPVTGFTIARDRVRCAEGVRSFLSACGCSAEPEIVDCALAGGYGRTCAEELGFLADFTKRTSIMLDPVYAGKALWGLVRHLDAEAITGERILFVHTGSWPLAAEGMSAWN